MFWWKDKQIAEDIRAPEGAEVIEGNGKNQLQAGLNPAIRQLCCRRSACIVRWVSECLMYNRWVSVARDDSAIAAAFATYTGLLEGLLLAACCYTPLRKTGFRFLPVSGYTTNDQQLSMYPAI